MKGGVDRANRTLLGRPEMKSLELLLAIATLGLALLAGCSQSSSTYPSASSPAASPTPGSAY
jgi:hypothetical protein